jgi:hypothetical protein
MLVKYHILTGFVISLLIWFLFPQIGWFYTLIIFLASFLIDFDHYLWYALKKKDWNLVNAVNFFYKQRDFFLKMKISEREKYKNIIMIFHGIECWILLVLLILVHKVFLFVLIGMGIHMILDFIDLYNHNLPFHIKTSQIYTHQRNKNKKAFI